MSFVITTVSPKSVVQVSDTRLSSLSDQSVLSEELRKTLVVTGRVTQFVLGWCGLATAGKDHSTAEWIFKVLYGMSAVDLNPDQIVEKLAELATRQFGALNLKDKRCHFLLGGWHKSEPFLGVISNYSNLDSLEAHEPDLKHHIPSFSDAAAATPRFQAWILRFRNLTERHYVVNVFGDCPAEKLKTHFRGLEGLLKKGAEARTLSAACRQIVLEAGRHSKTIGKNLVSVEMQRGGETHCSYYSDEGAEV